MDEFNKSIKWTDLLSPQNGQFHFRRMNYYEIHKVDKFNKSIKWTGSFKEDELLLSP